MTATVLEVHTVTLTELGGSAPVEKTQKSGLQIVSHQEQLASQVNSTHAY